VSLVRIVHLADLHLGSASAPSVLDGLEAFVPQLEADLIVVGGDLSERARHGELLAARGTIRRIAAGRPALVIPGNHDVQWWWRPFLPIGRRAIVKNYTRYFGVDLVPTIELPGVIVASALTSYGLTWGSLTMNPVDLAVKGHLPAAEVRRVTSIFTAAPTGTARVLVLHHNVLPGPITGRLGLARWRQAQRQVAGCGAELLLCGHDHEERAELLDGRIVVATTGTVSTRVRGQRPQAFNVLEIAADRIGVTFHRWDAGAGRFRASDVHTFMRRGTAGPIGQTLEAARDR